MSESSGGVSSQVIEPIPSEQVEVQNQGRDLMSGVSAAVATAGVVLVAKNWEETVAALGFLGPDGQEGRQAYVDAQDIQEGLVEAREAQPQGDEFGRIVGGVVEDPALQEDVVALTGEPLPDNAWLTPEEGIAGPLQGIGGLILAAGGAAALVTRRYTRRQARNQNKKS